MFPRPKIPNGSPMVFLRRSLKPHTLRIECHRLVSGFLSIWRNIKCQEVCEVFSPVTASTVLRGPWGTPSARSPGGSCAFQSIELGQTAFQTAPSKDRCQSPVGIVRTPRAGVSRNAAHHCYVHVRRSRASPTNSFSPCSVLFIGRSRMAQGTENRSDFRVPALLRREYIHAGGNVWNHRRLDQVVQCPGARSINVPSKGSTIVLV